MSEVKYYTKEGLEKLREELKRLKAKDRRHISEQIAEAREKGDLRENAEYKAAKEAQALLENRIFKLENALAHARVQDISKIDTYQVFIFCKVKVRHKDNRMEFTYTLVGEEETNIKEQKISVASPIGKGLMGKKVGETALINAPAGPYELEILKIEA